MYVRKMASTCENVFRPLAHFPEDIWGDRFLHSDVNPSQIEGYAKEIGPLKEQVRAMLVDDSVTHKHKLELINVVERLGISYYFEQEIESQLELIFKAYKNHEKDYDLYTVGVHFLVFRQHGYKMSCDVFNKFKDSHGKLQESLRSDVKGMLSLNEAAHMGMHNEVFMEDALALSTDVLESEASWSNLDDEFLHKQVVHSMKQAWPRGIKRVETGRFIGFYEANESRNETLLRLAKLDFNMIQLVHRQELSQLVKWWKDLDVKTQLPHVRDRSVECHYLAGALFYEARYSRARLILSKVLLMLAILDDTYDAYATMEELHLLTQAFERWDKSAIDELPGKLKIVFKHVFNLYEELEKDMAREGREYAARYAKASVMDLIRCYYMEARWANEGYIPSFEEYLENARITSTVAIATSSALLGTDGEIGSEKAFEWLAQTPAPRLLESVQVIARLMDDIVSHQEEQERGLHVASGVECYMHEHGVSRDEAVAVLRKMTRDAWKDVNEELVKPASVPRGVLELPINLGRWMDALYKDMDGFTHPAEVMKDEALLVYTQAFQV